MFLVVGIAGALVGGIGLSVLTAMLAAVMEPESFGETQFAMGFAFTVPAGMMLGGVTSLVLRQARRHQRTRAGWIAAVGGAAILAFATAIAWGSASSGGGGFAEFLRTLLSLWIGPSWFAGAALMIWGTRQLATRVSRRDGVRPGAND